jgi:hypothetical protein
MRSFRVTCNKALSVNYWAKKDDPRITFRGVHETYYPIIRNIKQTAKKMGIQYFWHFYEPYIEITWMSNEAQAKKLLKHIKKAFDLNGIKDVVFEKGRQGKTPGFAPDWFGVSDEENEFGGKRHAICSDMIDLFWEYREVIAKGRGDHEQLSRCIHTLCNPIGFNYTDEAKVCFSRGVLCLLISHLPYKYAIWIYTKLFRQKLPK